MNISKLLMCLLLVSASICPIARAMEGPQEPKNEEQFPNLRHLTEQPSMPGTDEPEQNQPTVSEWRKKLSNPLLYDVLVGASLFLMLRNHPYLIAQLIFASTLGYVFLPPQFQAPCADIPVLRHAIGREMPYEQGILHKWGVIPQIKELCGWLSNCVCSKLCHQAPVGAHQQ